MHIDSLNMQFSGFEEARNSLYGGMAGAMMANIGVSILGLVFPPLAAAAGIAALVGAAVGGWKASDGLKTRRQVEALAQLEKVLSDTVRRAQSQSIRQFENIAAEYEKGVRDALRKATAEVEQEIAGKMESISEQRQRSRDEAKQKADGLRRMLEQADIVLRNLARLTSEQTELPHV